MSLRIAIASKGRLHDDSLSWLSSHGIDVIRAEDARQYLAQVKGFEGLEAVLMAAGEIPAALASGRVELGITGRDLIQERLAGWQGVVDELKPLGFGRADLVLAVPRFWVDVDDLDDLDAAAADFRARNGMRMRVATKYPRIVGNFLHANDVTNFQLVPSQGATEGVVANEYAEMIADITTTGQTLRANHLKVLGAPILRSEACLFGSFLELETGTRQLLTRLAEKIR